MDKELQAALRTQLADRKGLIHLSPLAHFPSKLCAKFFRTSVQYCMRSKLLSIPRNNTTVPTRTCLLRPFVIGVAYSVDESIHRVLF